MSWSVLDFGKHEGKSLPQVLFSDPDWFFWAVETNLFKKRAVLLPQVSDLLRKATHVKVLQKDKERKVVEHHVHPSTRKYSHFKLVAKSRSTHFGSSQMIRENVIDMSAPRRIAGYDKTGCKSLISSLKEHYFENRSERMTKGRCEQFFDDTENFE